MKNLNKRVVTVAAVAGAALVAVTGTAGVADAQKLPGATKTRSFDEGSITMRLYDESARIERAVTNVPTSREVWVSGKVAVTTKGGVKGGNINVGYLIGCQLNFGASVGGSGQYDVPFGPLAAQDAKPGWNSDNVPGVNGGFELSPGKAAYVPIIKTSINGNDVNSFNFNQARGGVAYSQERFGVDGCAGHAEGMAKVTVRVATDTFKGNITMYGKPFSLG
ncbi:MspA family porin [Gordonia sp. PP30]|uniref:MspA family porin n=1 Tax=Gordonia sp. PP30 TaxID=2935861 RepID=UPI001FFE9AF3|nr:MspA family porin [Gordonia sp. PP30]UQE75863.1 MspA family porin [Gordonia sp. PP30]